MVPNRPALATPDQDPAAGHSVDDDRLGALLGVVFRLQLSHRELTSEVQQQTGLSRSDLTALGLLVGGPSVPVKELSVALGLTAGSTSTLVERLVRAGVATRTASPSDRRIVLIEISDAGRAVIGAVRARYTAAATEALDHVPASCIASTTALLAAFASNLSGGPTSAATVRGIESANVVAAPARTAEAASLAAAGTRGPSRVVLS